MLLAQWSVLLIYLGEASFLLCQQSPVKAKET